MIISPLHNDALNKKEFWMLFSENYNCNFKHVQTPSRDINILKMEFFFKDIKINFLESDAKPHVCEFEIIRNKRLTIDISQITIFDRLFFIFKGKHKSHSNSFLKRYKIQTNDRQILDDFLNDNELLNLMNKSEFFGLYAYTDSDLLKVRITSTYFVNNYEKLVDIYSITCRVIEHLR